MGFTLAGDITVKVTTMARTMGTSDEAVVIPDTNNQVLVRLGSRAFHERMKDTTIFKIPVRLKTVIGGVETEELFFVCTK